MRYSSNGKTAASKTVKFRFESGVARQNAMLLQFSDRMAPWYGVGHDLISCWSTNTTTGDELALIERMVWDHEVQGLNPQFPTNFASIAEMDQRVPEEDERKIRYLLDAPKEYHSSSAVYETVDV